MRIIVLGADGYLGWPTCMYLANRGHQVLGVDNYYKRSIERAMGIKPLIVPTGVAVRAEAFKRATGHDIQFQFANLSDYSPIMEYVSERQRRKPAISRIIKEFEPDAIVHYAEQPSAPYSMIDPSYTADVMINNLIGTLNVLWTIKGTDIHLVKLGTMGEYGTPNIDIEEGWMHLEINGRRQRVMYPKSPGSWYHASKVHDAHNIEMACRVWGCRATELNQGVVYGVHTFEMGLGEGLGTSFHYDAVFGTAINRFVTQVAIGEPITVYGTGGQTRGFLNILDTLRCVELACLNPAEPGEMRIYNQFTEQFSIGRLAKMVASANKKGPSVIKHLKNPRAELEDHYYKPKHEKLLELGLEPYYLDEHVLSSMIEHVRQHADNVDKTKLMPDVEWK